MGVVGGGQLARMSQPAAIALGIPLTVLALDPAESAAQVIPDAPIGAHTDLDALRALAARVDVVTFDHEHVPGDLLAALVSEGATVRPGPDALVHAQDKAAMRRRLTDAGIPAPRWTVAQRRADVAAFADTTGWPVIAKTPRGGYDGKGVRVAASADDLDDWLAAAGSPGPLADGVLLEEAVAFEREVAALVARRPSGESRAWPLVETVQTDGICTEVLAPAPDVDPESAATATDLALSIADALDVTGVLAVELFDLGPAATPRFLVNELAMRPHNSGHWTIDGAVTSQFEQHLRAVLDLPLGATDLRAPHTVMANVLGGPAGPLHPNLAEVLADPDLRVHLYGKDVRPGRKVGHVTASGHDLADLRRRTTAAAATFRGATP